MPQRYIISPTQGRWTLAVLMMLLLTVINPLVADAAPRNTSAGTVTGNEYEDQVLGAGHGEGDVWGGEQGAPVEPVGDLVPAESVTNTRTGTSQAYWLLRLAALFAWIRSSLWFSNLN